MPAAIALRNARMLTPSGNDTLRRGVMNATIQAKCGADKKRGRSRE
jgi:hypothetical protein